MCIQCQVRMRHSKRKQPSRETKAEVVSTGGDSFVVVCRQLERGQNMPVILGVITGLLINHLIINPIMRKMARDECVREGLAPKDWN